MKTDVLKIFPTGGGRKEISCAKRLPLIIFILSGNMGWVKEFPIGEAFHDS